jgi:hypothetical protein
VQSIGYKTSEGHPYNDTDLWIIDPTIPKRAVQLTLTDTQLTLTPRIQIDDSYCWKPGRSQETKSIDITDPKSIDQIEQFLATWSELRLAVSTDQEKADWNEFISRFQPVIVQTDFNQ